MDKKSLVGLLERTAEVLELIGENPFKVKNFMSAARALEEDSRDLSELEALQFIGVPRLGKPLAQAMMDALKTGEFAPLLEAARDVPPGVLEMFGVRGIGAKKIRVLWDAGITSLEELKSAAEAGKVAALKGFGQKSEATILENVRFALESATRHSIAKGLEVARTLLEHLGDFEPRVLGSVGRGLETVGDVDLSVTGSSEAVRSVLEMLSPLEHPNLEHKSYPTWSGTLSRVRFEVAYSSAENRPVTDALLSGSAWADFLLERARARGFELSIEGLFRAGNRVELSSEAALYAALELPDVPLEYREKEHLERGILFLASLPASSELIKVEDIRGMLHVHSQYSDGAATVRQMIEGALERGYAYLGMGDHSVSAFYANGLSVERLRAQMLEIDALRAEGFPILKGSEVDILADGSLDYPDEVLEQLDYVVASVHSLFNLSKEAQTERLVRAVSHPLVTILGHATGRLLLRRPSYEVDIDAVMAAAATHNTAIEINANPWRLDVDWRTALEWRDRVHFAINTDAHVVLGLDDLQYGILMARKAGLTPANVVNCLSLEEFKSFARG